MFEDGCCKALDRMFGIDLSFRLDLVWKARGGMNPPSGSIVRWRMTRGGMNPPLSGSLIRSSRGND